VLEGSGSHWNAVQKQCKAFNLTWNGDNEIGSGTMAAAVGDRIGRMAVPELERQGVVVDVSHLNDAGFYEVASLAKRPFGATTPMRAASAAIRAT
jgi:membrane dipeptidase